MRRLPEADLSDSLRDFEAKLIERYGVAFVKRLEANLIVGVPGFIVLNALFSPVGLGYLWVQIPVAVAYSWLTARFRFTGFVSGLTLLATQFVLLSMTGYSGIIGGWGFEAIGRLAYWMGVILFFAFGLVLGIVEEARIQDDG